MDIDHTPAPSPAIAQLCEELHRWVGTLGPILAHMHAHRDLGLSADDAPPIAEILHELLAGTLAPLEDRHGSDALVAATAVLQEAGVLVAEEIFLVVPEEMASPPRGVRPRRRRPRRGHG